MDLQLTGKKAIVTGASRGIGRAIARQLALEGCDVAICARTAGPLQEAAAALAHESGRKVVPIVCDTQNAEAIKRFVNTAARELGGLNIVINNAGRLRLPARDRLEQDHRRPCLTGGRPGERDPTRRVGAPRGCRPRENRSTTF